VTLYHAIISHNSEMKSQNCEVKGHNYLFIFYSVVGKELPYFSLVFFC